jgi:hypothetical protein
MVLPFCCGFHLAAGGTGFSDHVNALLVGLDLLKKALKARPALTGARARRKLLMMGTFDAEVRAPAYQTGVGSKCACGVDELRGRYCKVI